MADHNATPDPPDVPDSPESGSAELARLFREHNASLVQLLRTRLRSDQEAWDVAQEAYVRMLQLDRVDTISYLRGYLFRTAVNIATDRLRSRAVHKTVQQDPMFELGIDELSPDRTVVAAEALQGVGHALRGLPPKARQAFLMSRLDDLPLGEIALRLGVSDRMVRNYIQQALLACRAALKERQP